MRRRWAALAALGGLFANFYLLIPVIPLLVVDQGLGVGVAGSVSSTLFAVTVITQLFIPRMLRVVSARTILAVGVLLLSAPAVLHLSTTGGVVVHLAAAAIRGVGFGMSTVTIGVLIVALSDQSRRGRAIGVMGIVSAIPAVLGPPAALLLAQSVGLAAPVLLAVSLGLVGVGASIGVGKKTWPPDRSASSLLEVLRTPKNVDYLTAFACGAMVYGALLSFMPFVFPQGNAISAPLLLFVFGALRAGGRWYAGVLIDRHPDRQYWGVTIAMMLVGLTLLALQAPASALLGAALAGGGFGALQCVSQVTMFRGESRRHGAANTLWNVSFDVGSAVGAAGFGVMLAVFGAQQSLWLIALPAVVAALIIGQASRRTVNVEHPG